MAEFLNNNIKFLRNKNGISQQGLADKVGIDRSTVSRIENNEIETTIDNAIKIAEALNVSLYDLVGKDLRIDNNTPTLENEEQKKLATDKGVTIYIDKIKGLTAEDVLEVNKVLMEELEKKKKK